MIPLFLLIACVNLSTTEDSMLPEPPEVTLTVPCAPFGVAQVIPLATPALEVRECSDATGEIRCVSPPIHLFWDNLEVACTSGVWIEVDLAGEVPQ